MLGADAWYIAVVIYGREFKFVNMKDAEVAESDRFFVSWKNTISNRIDTVRLKTEMPEVYKNFVKPCESRRFLVKAV